MTIEGNNLTRSHTPQHCEMSQTFSFKQKNKFSPNTKFVLKLMDEYTYIHTLIIFIYTILIHTNGVKHAHIHN